jgi:beta-lactam-binding protein with PASTA domain
MTLDRGAEPTLLFAAMPTAGEGGTVAGPRGFGDWRLWVAIVAVAAIVVVVALLVAGDDGEGTSVPAVIGLAEGQASDALVAKGFSTQIERQHSSEVHGTVLAQQPDAGSALEEGEVVVLTVSSQPGGGGLAGAEQPSGPVEVPDVVGRQQVLAGASLERLGLVPDTRPVQRGDKCCVVVEQKPRPGTTLEAGESVLLSVAFVGADRLEIPVPELEGLSAAAARATARELGFTMSTLERPAPSPDLAGKVFEQSPGAGDDAPEFSRLRLFVGT